LLWSRTGNSAGDLSYLWWDLRPRPDYGTLEFRVADTQLETADSGAIAAVCQTLVAALAERRRSGLPLPVHESHRLSENRWRALRDGLDGTLIDPDSGAIEPTRERIARLLEELEPHGQPLGCARELAHCWSLLDANGATRQRAIANRDGPRGLLEWLANPTEHAAAAENVRPSEAPPPTAVPPERRPPEVPATVAVIVS
jgi:glutamate---cysteine ligase / carboxylate-amine ligase